MNRDADFWNQTPLEALSAPDWERLCDGCGKCCLHKLQNEDTGDVFYTRVACRLLDTTSGGCGDYTERFNRVADCMDVAKMTHDEMSWLPSTCAYRLRSEGRPLPHWHPLLTGDAASIQQDPSRIRGRIVSELDLAKTDLDDHLEDYIVRWIEA